MAQSTELSSRGSRFIVLASTFLIVAALYLGRGVLVPLAVAVLLSFVLTPLVRWLERIRLPRLVSVLIVVLVGVGFLAVIGYVVGRQFVSVIEQLPDYQGELRAKIASIKSGGHFFQKLEREITADVVATTQLATVPAAASTEGARPSATQPSAENPMPVRIVEQWTPFRDIGNYAGSFIEPLADAGLILVLLVFMLYSREDLRDRMIRLVGHGRLNLTTKALDDAGSRISRYLGALAIVNTCYGICVSLGLWGIGHLFGRGHAFPNVMVWGLLVAVFRFVPYVGIFIAASVPVLLSFALFPGSAVFFATLALFAVLEVAVSQFIEPYWYGNSTGMSALAVLIAAMFWTWLWGPAGLLLSTPLTVCLVVIGKHVPPLQFLDILLGDEPVLLPHVRLYQRLISGDEEEALDLADAQLKQHSLLEVFDDVLVPALALAEADYHRDSLEDERIAFVRQGMRGIIEELGEVERRLRVTDAADGTEKEAKEQPPAPSRTPSRPSLPRDCVVNVLLLPAKSESDEIVCLMLHLILELRGYRVSTTAVHALASEMVDLVESSKADVVCVSAMPPAAVAHARYLCKRIHIRFSDMQTVVGLWTAKGDLRKAKTRVACAESVPVITSLAEAEHEIDQLAQPILVRGGNGEGTRPSATTAPPG
jgi:predicted PurR-regulated permease PerM